MKKIFKEINLLKLIISLLIIIICVLMTTFLILCREWIKEDNLSLCVCVVICIFNIVISNLFIITVFGEILEFIKNKKEKKNIINKN